MQRFLSFFYKQKDLIVLLLILCLAAYLRLWRISEYMTFLGDEGRDALVVKRMLVDHDFTLLGPTASVGGFYLGPIYYYLMLPFMWLWQLNPTGAAVMVGLFGTATVGLIYLLAKELCSKYAAYVASTLYALSPLVIAQSRSSWNPNVVPFFSTILILLLWKLYKQKNVSLLFWIGVVLGVGIQLHYLFGFLYVLVIVWMLFLWRLGTKITFKNAIIGLLGIVCGASLFLLFEIRHGFPNTRSIIQFVFRGDDTGFVSAGFLTNITDIFYRLFSRLLIRLPDRGVLDMLPSTQEFLWIHSGTLVVTTAFFYCLFILYKTVPIFKILFVSAKNKKIVSETEDRQMGLFLLFLWCAIPLILFGFYRRAIYDYYFVIFFPWPFILLGDLLTRLFERKYLKYFSLALWVLLAIWNWQGRPFLYRPNNQFEQMKRISQAAFAKTEGKPFNFALVTGGNSDHVYRFFFEIWGNPPVSILNSSIDPKRNTVTDQLIVICETPCEPLGHPLWEIAGFGRAQIESVQDVPFVKVYRLIHYIEEEVTVRL